MFKNWGSFVTFQQLCTIFIPWSIAIYQDWDFTLMMVRIIYVYSWWRDRKWTLRGTNGHVAYLNVVNIWLGRNQAKPIEEKLCWWLGAFDITKTVLVWLFCLSHYSLGTHVFLCDIDSLHNPPVYIYRIFPN